MGELCIYPWMIDRPDWSPAPHSCLEIADNVVERCDHNPNMILHYCDKHVQDAIDNLMYLKIPHRVRVTK